jgi:hypothetical protein
MILRPPPDPDAPIIVIDIGNTTTILAVALTQAAIPRSAPSVEGRVEAPG